MTDASCAGMKVDEPNWKPLESVLPRFACEEFMYMGRCGDIHLYKHYFSRRYLNNSSDAEHFYRYSAGLYLEVTREIALDSLRG